MFKKLYGNFKRYMAELHEFSYEVSTYIYIYIYVLIDWLIIRISTHFFIHTYLKKIQIMLLKQHYQRPLNLSK